MEYIWYEFYWYIKERLYDIMYHIAI